jgi:hypothetical protein
MMIVKDLVMARMHESGCYFFCPRCTLSFRHPPDFWHRYLVGYGYCVYCYAYVPIEGGDKKGVVRADAAGKLYTVLYDANEREMTKERWDVIVAEVMAGKSPFRDGRVDGRKREDRRSVEADRRSWCGCDLCG